MRSGRETLASIEEALQDIKTQESRLQGELEQTNRKWGETAALRLEALRGLATIRARDAMADGVVNEADNLSGEVRTILQARLKTIAQFNQRQEQADAERGALVRRLDDLNSEIAALEEKLDRFGEQARAYLKADPAYKSLAEEHDNISAVLERAKAKAEQVSRDEDEKGRPYRSDPLFMYLWNRQFGTSAYQATGLVKFLDEWVAGLIRYADARSNYAMLTEIPIRLRAHAQDLGKTTLEIKAKLDKIETAKIQGLAGTDITTELTSAREQQSGLNEKLASVTAELTETGNQLKLYAKGDDQSFQYAVQSYAAFLEKESLQRLMADAFATKTQDDDVLVEDVRGLGRDLESLQISNEKLRRRLDQLYDKKQELARLSANFRREYYDDTGSQFSGNPDLEELLKLVLRGVISAAEYWARAQSQQQWRHRAGDPWRRQSGLPPFERWPGGMAGGGTWGEIWRRSTGSSSSSGSNFQTGGKI
jgi:chromosome segregation ATPase